MAKEKILLVDDEAAARYGLRKALQPHYSIVEAENGITALKKIEDERPDVVLCDIKMPEMDGIELLKAVQKKGSGGTIPLFIMITAYGSERIAVDAMKAGAYDYLSKPYDIEELRLIVAHAVERLVLQRENVRLRQQLGDGPDIPIIGKSILIQEVLGKIAKVAQTDVTVLLTGESGTGKELAARALHEQSSRHHAPFVTMNCAAIPKDLVESELFGHEKGAFTGAVTSRKGKFEIADGGTLFLDEIADMSLKTQAKILRVLEDKTIVPLGGKEEIKTNVRLVSATNKDLKEEIAKSLFRQDLYYRIKVIEIHLPSLAERREDIPPLADYFVKRFSEKHHKPIKFIDPGAMQLIQHYIWPGNVRQLQNVIEQCVVLSEERRIMADHLPDELRVVNAESLKFETGNAGLIEAKKRLVRQFERDMINGALRRSGGNVSEAARRLKIKRQFLQQKMQHLGINADGFR
ncbi:response regulator [candidate division KSB1 bacterium]|nr:response regulator [candidate division KSB1 bacterium]